MEWNILCSLGRRLYCKDLVLIVLVSDLFIFILFILSVVIRLRLEYFVLKLLMVNLIL